jgi:hypothetical protein
MKAKVVPLREHRGRVSEVTKAKFDAFVNLGAPRFARIV